MNAEKIPKKVRKSVFLDLFRVFFDTFLQTPKETLFETFLRFRVSESVSTGVWCVPGFGAGFEIALEPSKLQK